MKYIKSFEKFIMEGKVSKNEKIDIYRDNNYIVVEPLTHKASCKYGAFSKWCISVPNTSYIFDEGSPNHIIFIIQKNFTPTNIENIQKFLFLKEKYDDGEDLTEDEMDIKAELEYDMTGYDFSKICIIQNKDKSVDIWDFNNNLINENHYRTIYDLPIDNKVLDIIDNYLEN